jgi:CHASE1-domain containing sensor protein
LKINFRAFRAGFARFIKSKEKAEHIAVMRATGSKEYDIRPSGEREIYAPITYLQPPNWRNQRAIGYDMYSKPFVVLR